MSLFDGVQKSTAQKKYETILETSSKILQGEKVRCKAMFDNLWSGLETKEDAQAVMDLFGADAASLFITHKAWQDFIKAIDPSYEMLTPPFNLTFNADGTVTVGEKMAVENA